MGTVTFPNESREYRAARDRLLEAEIELRSHVERVAAMRRRLPLGGALAEDYRLEEMGPDGRVRPVRFSELFAPGKDTLFVYGFMFGPEMEAACPMCTALLDGLDGNAAHIAQRINLAVVATSPVARIAQFAAARGWSRLRVLSSGRGTYQRDYHAEDADGEQMPMANVFVRRGGAIHHFWGTELLFADVDGHPRHMDLMWPLWNVLDTTPEGRGEDWYPALEY